MYEIIDDNGTIHSGSEEEMNYVFDIMMNPHEYNRETRNDWNVRWKGDLKLVKVIKTHH